MALRGADLTGTEGPALMADSAAIQGDIFLDGGFRATGGRRLPDNSSGTRYATVQATR